VLNSQCHIGISRDRWIALGYLGGAEACPRCGATHDPVDGHPIYLVMEFDHIISIGASSYTANLNRCKPCGSYNVQEVLRMGPERAREVYQALCPTCHRFKSKLGREYKRARGVALADSPKTDQPDFFKEQNSNELC
jgi:hypothetical protein